jgi:hypothetical protein
MYLSFGTVEAPAKAPYNENNMEIRPFLTSSIAEGSNEKIARLERENASLKIQMEKMKELIQSSSDKKTLWQRLRGK